jgi:uncharacterized protein
MPSRTGGGMPSLLAATTVLVALLYVIGLPAAFLLGAMGAGMAVAGRGGIVRLPRWIFPHAQAVVGCLMAKSFTIILFRTIGQHLPLFVTASLSVLLVATGLGLVLTYLRVLPGSTVLWGSFPGGATVMVLLSESYGADMRLVAFMQYLRVVVVAVTASLVARFWGFTGVVVPHPAWLAPLAWPSFAVVCAIVLIGGAIVPRLRIPAGALLVPLALATVLQDVGLVRIDLPQPLLAGSYVVIGWTIGLRFTPDILHQAARALPSVLASMATLVATCAALGWALAHLAHLDILTGYLATSPGGADSIAIIAASTSVDVPLVMAIQVGRFLTVLLLGPTLARWAARLTGTSGATGTDRLD